MGSGSKALVTSLEAGHAPRGWHEVTVGDAGDGHGGQRYAVRDGYVLLPCTGDAHSNGYVDNCGICLEHVWGWFAHEEAELTDEARIEAAAATFPAQFGLRAFPGDVFRIGLRQSYMHNGMYQGERFSEPYVLLYTQRLVDSDGQETWLDFAKGTVDELRREVLPLQDPDLRHAAAPAAPERRGGKREGAGRKPKPEGRAKVQRTKQRVVLSLSAEDADLLATMATTRGCTQSELVIAAAKFAFGNQLTVANAEPTAAPVVIGRKPSRGDHVRAARTAKRGAK